MLSSIASFLPSALHIGTGDTQPPPQFSQDDPVSEEEQDDYRVTRSKETDQPQSIAKPREKTANESFIIVRPPPSKSNHPLNLQVQLVPPNTRPPNGVVSQSNISAPTTPTDSDHTLARTSSTRSDASYSNYGSSTSSFASVASSSTSTRRTIVPLYNLQAHNVMTNVIVDAGTDARIAKFQRRGIILIDLGSLEPIEVWGDPSSTGRASMSLTVDDQQNVNLRSSAFSTRSNAASSRAHTPERHLTAASSAISLGSTKQSQPNSHHQNPSHVFPQAKQHLPLPPLPLTTSTTLVFDSDTTTPSLLPTNVSSKRNIFGKLFQSGSSKKLFNPSASPSVPPSSASPTLAISSPPQDSSQVTPKAASRHPSGTATPTSNGSSKGERGHGRNLSLTAFTAPIKSTFKNKSRSSSVVPESPSSLSLDPNSVHPEGQRVGLGITQGEGDIDAYGEKGSISPNMSASSLAVTSESAESGSVNHSSAAAATSGGGSVPMHATLYLHPSSHGHQSSTTGSVSSAPQTVLQQLQSRPPVLGIQPTYVSALGGNLSGPNDVKKMRALMYVWLVQKWFKRPPDENSVSFSSVTGGLGGAGFLGLGSKSKDKDLNCHSTEPGAGVEVRFEWKRARAKGSGGRGRGRTGRELSNYDDGKRRRGSTSTIGELDGGEGAQTEREKSRESNEKRRTDENRLSGVSARSIQSLRSGSGKAGSDEGAETSSLRKQRRRSAGASVDAEGGDGDRDEEDSDPEDSETPWVCTLKVRRTRPTPLASNGNTLHATPPLLPSSKGSGLKQEVLRVKMGTLSPTPHHPKVVAMLKVPFPLPDVEVERLSIRRRGPGSPPGQATTNEFGEVGRPVAIARDYGRGKEEEEYKGLMLTAEELKDIVCSTALWLIVREGIGGVGRVTRKGDGWRIRH